MEDGGNTTDKVVRFSLSRERCCSFSLLRFALSTTTAARGRRSRTTYVRPNDGREVPDTPPVACKVVIVHGKYVSEICARERLRCHTR